MKKTVLLLLFSIMFLSESKAQKLFKEMPIPSHLYGNWVSKKSSKNEKIQAPQQFLYHFSKNDSLYRVVHSVKKMDTLLIYLSITILYS